mmetsp:Transcript_11616/g.30868  ORF Transcript_11616/g.30868 Transcript_11616/m.30868 type:complete len:80 (-) Transcript_11616:10-249(-)
MENADDRTLLQEVLNVVNDEKERREATDEALHDLRRQMSDVVHLLQGLVKEVPAWRAGRAGAPGGRRDEWVVPFVLALM